MMQLIEKYVKFEWRLYRLCDTIPVEELSQANQAKIVKENLVGNTITTTWGKKDILFPWIPRTNVGDWIYTPSIVTCNSWWENSTVSE